VEGGVLENCIPSLKRGGDYPLTPVIRQGYVRGY
jgi:hypothetical protein